MFSLSRTIIITIIIITATTTTSVYGPDPAKRTPVLQTDYAFR